MPSIRPAPYQLVALSKTLVTRGAPLLITDGVGVGKTIAAGYCIYWSVAREGHTALVVCPVSLVDKWVNELRSKFDLEAHPIRSAEEMRTAERESELSRQGRVYVLPFSRIDLPMDLEYNLLVVDEIHNFRNNETKSWNSMRALAAKATQRIGLTATPVNNSVDDLFHEYAILCPESPGIVVDAALGHLWGQRETGVLNALITRFLKEKLKIHFARREIRQVIVDYPESYSDHVNKTVHELTGRRGGRGRFPLETITYYRTASSSPAAFAKSTATDPLNIPDSKRAALIELVGDLRRQAIVFCQYRETISYLTNALPDLPCYVVTGDVPGPSRMEILERFRKDPRGILFLTAVGSEGLDLQFCDVVINYDLHWNPMVLEQRIGRIDRVGQTKSEILVYNFHVAGSIDEKLVEVISDKLSKLEGSPFSPAPITSSRSQLYDSQALERERLEAIAALRGLEESRALASADLRILPSINAKFCDPKALLKAKPLEWLKVDPTTQAWQASTTRAFQTLEDKLKQYGEAAA
ncbi:MAG TPA: helicase-related protein [Candidatus Thermoplasmatota archaeon]|nr:helicase-related protein [Candidatus Thermoplasmatota archaeon]